MRLIFLLNEDLRDYGPMLEDPYKIVAGLFRGWWTKSRGEGLAMRRDSYTS